MKHPRNLFHSKLQGAFALGVFFGLLSSCAIAAENSSNLLRANNLWSAEDKTVSARLIFDSMAMRLDGGATEAKYSCSQPIPTSGLKLTLRLSVDATARDGEGGISLFGIFDPENSDFFALRYIPGPPARLLVGNRSIPVELAEEDYGQPLELELVLGGGRIAIRRGGTDLTTVSVEERLDTVVLSLWAKNARVVFTRLQVSSGLPSAPPTFENLTVPGGANELRSVPSPWVDYFGETRTSVGQMKGYWFSTIRGYSNLSDYSVAHLKFEDPVAGDPEETGPFDDHRFRFRLEDVVCSRPGAGTLIEHTQDLIRRNIASIYVTTNLWGAKEARFNRDTAYWVMRRLHERFPEANKHVYFQWGNEINGNHFDMFTADEKAKIPGNGPWKYSNLPQKQEMYVERYLAPAVESVRRAAQDVYGDPRAIPVLSGSFANAYSPAYRQWMYEVLDRVVEGKQAPSLKGKKVWELIDILTIHYPLSNENGAANLQEIWDRYGKSGRIKGLWITEQYGRNAGKGPVTILEKGLEFVEWATQNQLSAEQTRLVWWGTWYEKAGGKGSIGVELLGKFFGQERLSIGHRDLPGGKVYIVAVGPQGTPSRILIAVIPSSGSSIGLEEIDVPRPSGAKDWDAELVQLSVTRPPSSETMSPTEVATRQQLKLHRQINEPLVIFLRQDSNK